MTAPLAFTLRFPLTKPFDLLDAPPQVKTKRERALLDLFRGMSDEQQDVFFQATAVLAKPVSRVEDDEEKRA